MLRKERKGEREKEERVIFSHPRRFPVTMNLKAFSGLFFV